MNCKELMQLLDDGDIRSVPHAKRQELDVHLSQCADCAAEWRVQERIIVTPAMAVPTGFVSQCRQLVAAGASRLSVRRRMVLYVSLPLIAAAALLAWSYFTSEPGLEAVASAPVATMPVPSLAEPEEPALTQEPLRLPLVPPASGTFTVAVPPLQIEGVDTEGGVLATRFRERVMELLQDVPNLQLVDKSKDTISAEYELRMKYTGGSAAPPTRSVSIEVGKSAEFAATEAAIAAEATMSPEDQQLSRLARQRADMEKRRTSYQDADAREWSLIGLGGAPQIALIFLDGNTATDRLELAAQQLVRNLRVNVFPIDESYEQEELAILLSPSQPEDLRLRALRTLLLYAERRGGLSSAGAHVVRAGGEFALADESATTLRRPDIWDALALTGSPELVPYLIRGLDEIERTEMRLQLVRILAGKYGSDPRAQAALTAAARSNDQETVRMAAMRSSDASQWQKYVIATLENMSLPDLQRLQPIAEMAGELGTAGTGPMTNIVLEKQQLRELGALVIKVATDPASTESAKKALISAGATETPAALDMLIQVADALRAENYRTGVEGAAVMGVRNAAHNVIGSRYTGNPKARAVIEDVARNGDAVARILAEATLQRMDMRAESENSLQMEQATQ